MSGRHVLFGILTAVLMTVCGHAQIIDTGKAEAEAEARIFRNSVRLPTRAEKEQARLRLLNDFRRSLPKFVGAVNELGAATTPAAARNATQKIEKEIDKIHRYARRVAVNYPDFEPPVATPGTFDEAAIAVLKLAADIRPYLVHFVRTEESFLIDMDFWKFLYDLDLEMSRLKWLCTQLKNLYRRS